MKLNLAAVLSFNGGYVDTVGFLALQGLFTAHVTGNFVTIGAALVFGTTGVISKLLALPIFCAVIFVTRRASVSLTARRLPALPILLAIQLCLLLAGGVFSLLHGAFTRGDSWPAVLAGMIFVAAMAMQNAAHRVHLASTPPSTLMTGTTTQLMIDLSDVLQGLAPASREATLTRMRAMTMAVIAFALGAAGAALLYGQFHSSCFAVPPLVAFLAYRTAAKEPIALKTT